MSTHVNRPVIVRRLWIVATLAMFVVYVTNPLWPHSVAQFPWRWWTTPICLVATAGICFYVSNHAGMVSAVLATITLTFCHFAEVAIGTWIYSSSTSFRPAFIMFIGSLYVGLLNALSQLPAVLIFVIFCIVQSLLARREA
jgi:hypothetical protein